MSEHDASKGQRISLLAPQGEKPPPPDVSRKTARRLFVLLALLHVIASLFLIRSLQEESLAFPYDYSKLVDYHRESIRAGSANIPRLILYPYGQTLLHPVDILFPISGFWPPFDSLRLTGFTYNNYRLVPLLTHVLMALLCYVITTHLSNRLTGLLAAFLILASPTLSQQSRQGLQYFAFPFEALIALACFAAWMRRPNILRAVLVLLSGLFLYTISSLVIPFAIVAAFLTCGRNLWRKGHFRYLVIIAILLDLFSRYRYGQFNLVGVISFLPFVVSFGIGDFLEYTASYINGLRFSLSTAMDRIGGITTLIYCMGFLVFLCKSYKLEARWYLLTFILLICPLLWNDQSIYIAYFILVVAIPIVAMGLLTIRKRWLTMGIISLVVISGIGVYIHRLVLDYHNAVFYPLTRDEKTLWAARTGSANLHPKPGVWPMKECLEELMHWFPNKINPKADGTWKTLTYYIAPPDKPSDGNVLTSYSYLGYQMENLANESWINLKHNYPGNYGYSNHDALVTIEDNAVFDLQENTNTHNPLHLVVPKFIRAHQWSVNYIYPTTMTLWVNSQYITGPKNIDVPIPAAFFDEIARLSRIDVSDYNLASGDIIDATLYWEILKQPDPGTSAYLHIFLPNKKIIPFYIEFYPQPTDRFYVTTAKMTIPAGMKPGEYKMGVGLYIAEKKYKYWREDLLDCYYRLKQPLIVNNPINTSISAAPPPS